MEESAADLRREFAEAMKRRGVTAALRDAPVERIADFLERMQERGEISLRRHDGQVVLIWGKDEAV